jgi:stage II sporulation protein D
MSQYGADFMARQGSTYDEILKHYYKGAEIQK